MNCAFRMLTRLSGVRMRASYLALTLQTSRANYTAKTHKIFGQPPPRRAKEEKPVRNEAEEPIKEPHIRIDTEQISQQLRHDGLDARTHTLIYWLPFARQLHLSLGAIWGTLLCGALYVGYRWSQVKDWRELPIVHLFLLDEEARKHRALIGVLALIPVFYVSLLVFAARRLLTRIYHDARTGTFLALKRSPWTLRERRIRFGPEDLKLEYSTPRVYRVRIMQRGSAYLFTEHFESRESIARLIREAGAEKTLSRSPPEQVSTHSYRSRLE